MSDYSTNKSSVSVWLIVGGAALLVFVLFAVFAGGGSTPVSPESQISAEPTGQTSTDAPASDLVPPTISE